VIKQMTTLSTGIIALTLTFLRDVTPKGADATLLDIGWLCFLASVIVALLGLMNLAGTLEARSDDSI
jgi:hypothetical protein